MRLLIQLCMVLLIINGTVTFTQQRTSNPCEDLDCTDDESCEELYETYGCNVTVERCEKLNCTEDERCGHKDGVYGCFCNEANPRPHPEAYDAIEVCESSSGLISLSLCQLFEAGFPGNSLHLNDPSCTGTAENGRLVFHFDNDENFCGTNFMSNGTHLIYKNIIMGGVDPSSTIISREERFLELQFSCIYELSQTITMDTVHPLHSIIRKTLPGVLGMYQVKMISYRDPDFSFPYIGSAYVEMDKRIYVEVLVEGVDSRQIATVIDSCWATPENDRNYAVRWDLILNECPNPEDDTVQVLHNGVSTTARFSFEMFSIDDQPNLYLHCSIHLCLLQSNNCPAHCYTGHHHPRHHHTGHNNRDRRSVDIHDTSFISMGPFISTNKSTK